MNRRIKLIFFALMLVIVLFVYIPELFSQIIPTKMITFLSNPFLLPSLSTSPWSRKFASQNAIACGEYSNCTKCFLNPMDFAGRIQVSLGKVTMRQLEVKYNYLQPGGHHVPAGCQALNRVAVIVPYRDRESHLRILLNNMHAFLTKQKLDYAIIIVEQVNNQTFNRAKLLNAGYVEARKLYNWECYVFHDVDLLPEDDRNLHTCPTKNPRHLAVAMNKFNYQLIYEGMFGTSSIFTTDQFERSNGFSNRYWGWGGEDDDMYKRVIMAGYKVDRYDAKFARYTMIRHGREKNNPDNPCRWTLLNRTGIVWKADGLNTLHYKLLNITLKKLFTHITVDLLEASERPLVEKDC